MTGYVYMLASQKNGTLYIGVTGSLASRIPQHKDGTGSKFAARYGVQRLVWYEEFLTFATPLNARKNSRNGDGRGRLP